jgi:hypothetical protein
MTPLVQPDDYYLWPYRTDRATDGGPGNRSPITFPGGCHINLDSGPVGRAVFQPGRRWSEHVKPLAQTDSCQVAHKGYCVLVDWQGSDDYAKQHRTLLT